jgi:hypothetical protein
MKQAAKLYWSQHKVFFIATLVLFPDRLNGHEVNQWFYRPYFAGDDPTFIEIELEDYQNAGYLTYEKPSALYKITDVNTQKAKKDLMQYLKQWQRDELLALSASKPPDPERQKELLLSAIVRDYSDHKNKPRITLESIYGKPTSYTYKPPFWELLLSYQFLDNKIKITYMDYDRRDDGLYDDDSQPTVELKIVDKELSSLVEQKAEPVLPTVPADIVVAQATPTNRQTFKASVIITDHIIYAMLDDGREYRISRQLRTDLSPHLFINHLLHHPRTFISRHDIKEAADSGDITELVRRCGFDRPLKKIFFPDTTEQAVYFQPAPTLDEAQVKLLAEHKWDKPRKGGKS